MNTVEPKKKTENFELSPQEVARIAVSLRNVARKMVLQANAIDDVPAEKHLREAARQYACLADSIQECRKVTLNVYEYVGIYRETPRATLAIRPRIFTKADEGEGVGV